MRRSKRIHEQAAAAVKDGSSDKSSGVVEERDGTVFFCFANCKSSNAGGFDDDNDDSVDDTNEDDSGGNEESKEDFALESTLLEEDLTQELLTEANEKESWNEIHAGMAIEVVDRLHPDNINKQEGTLMRIDYPYGHPHHTAWRPAAMDVYCGDDMGLTPRKQNVFRAAYATGSGQQTVGIDPARLRILPITDNLRRGAQKIQNIVKRLVLRHPTWSDVRVDVPVNAISMKVYYKVKAVPGRKTTVKKLGFHTDCTYKNNGSFDKKGNSQAERTLVVIATIGDPRYLRFRREVLVGDTWSVIEPRVERKMLLKETNLAVVNYLDEIPKRRPGKYSEHKTRFLHGVLGIEEQFSVSLAFRVVINQVAIDPRTDLLLRLTEKQHAYREKKGMDEKEDDWENSDAGKAFMTAYTEMMKEQLQQVLQRANAKLTSAQVRVVAFLKLNVTGNRRRAMVGKFESDMKLTHNQKFIFAENFTLPLKFKQHPPA